MTAPVRVRFAPAPSGNLHVGSARTALFNWLHARSTGGAFVFRIEDTDADRATDESMEAMADAMTWLGLDWDEGIRVGGPWGPYRQSERAALHAAVARRLEAAGVLYADDRTPDELNAWREQRREAGEAPAIKRSSTPATTGDRPRTLRLALPETGTVTLTDLVRGEVSWEWANEADPVLVRSDGSATYPLANTVDDVAQGITLVCRGEDLLSVTPRQLHLYDLLLADGLIDDALAECGLPARDPAWTRPREFAHLSIIVGADRKKLSKRHGSVAIQQLAAEGFLPETLVNAIALLGWSPPDGRERLDVDDLVEQFSFANVGKAAAAFDLDKLTAFNGERIRDLSAPELAERLVPFLDGTHGDALIASPPAEDEEAMINGLVPIVQERMQRLDEIQRYAPAFFADDVRWDPDSVAKVLGKDGAAQVLDAAAKVLSACDWTVEGIEAALRSLADDLEVGLGKVAQPVRVAVTGSSVSPPLFESLALLDRDVVVGRIRDGLTRTG
ncbi:MAG: glutamate--tRNA ligase family protein [Nitriliruptorales bacterium]|nr:glutamate--tRNA ligase family protein [Nitriliruptorales bacterium]